MLQIKNHLIAVFNVMRTLKFKPQPTVYVFRCRQSSKWTSRETEAHFSWVKRSCLSIVIGRFQSILFVSVFQGSLAVAIILIDSSEKPNRQLGFELQSSHSHIENHNNIVLMPSRAQLFCTYYHANLVSLIFAIWHCGLSNR